MDTTNNVDNSSNIINSKAASQPSRKLNIDLLKIIHAARQTYGLRTNDYARYHAHCVRRVNTLHRATKTLNKPSSSSTSSSSNKKSAASKNKNSSKNATSSSNSNKSSSYTSTTSQITPEAVLKDERLLELLVWEAERAWSGGMKQREEIAALERSNAQQQQQALASKRHRAVKRFHRASQHAEALSPIAKTIYNMSSDPITASAAFQIEIYYNYMRATHAFVKVSSPRSTSATGTADAISPASALATLSQAYVLLETYGQISQRATEEAIAFELLDELEPLIRFCAYKSGTHASQPPAEIAKAVGKDAVSHLEQHDKYPSILSRLNKEQSVSNSKSRKDFQTVHQLTWRDVDIPVRSAELAETLGKVKKAVSDVASRRSRKLHQPAPPGKAANAAAKPVSSSVYDRSLAVLIEAEDKARRLVEDNATALARAHSARFEAAAKPLTLIHSYILFHLLSVRTQRDEALLQETRATLARREAKVGSQNASYGPVSMRLKRRRMKLYPIIIKLLDSMAQSFEKMRQLAVVEEDSSDLADQVDALLAYSKARRCLYLGQTYAMLDNFPEAITLLQRGALYLRQARSIMETLTGEQADTVDIVTSGLATIEMARRGVNEMQAGLDEAESRARKDWYISTLQPSEKKPGEPATIDQAVKTLSLQANVVPKAKRKNAGPLFFDVAFSYIAPVATEMVADSQDAMQDSTPAATAVQDKPASASNQPEGQALAEPAARPQDSAQVEKAANTSGRGLWGFFGRRS